MIVLSALAVLLAPTNLPQPLVGPTGIEFSQDDPAKTFERRFQEAGENVEKLWELHLWAEAYGMERESRRCLRTIVRVDPQHRPANEALGHIFYAGRWFPNERRLAEFKKEEEARIAAEKGLVRFRDEWVPADDLPYLEKGLVRDDFGRWVDKEEYAKLQAGWRRQDLVWIPPDEVENIDKGLWKCGEKWLPIAEADAYHAQIGRWWSLPTDHFILHTTLSREVAGRATHVLFAAHRDLVRVVGVQPPAQVPVLLLNSQEQYQTVSAGRSPLGSVESHGLSSALYAFFADLWFDVPSATFHGAGIAYWDASTDAGNRFGPHALRHAAAQSFLEGVDPSPKTLQRTLGGRGQSHDLRAFYAEKRFPEWFRYGAAVYAERYFIDSTVGTGGNPHWAREWSVQNLVNHGGLRPIQQILTKPLDGGEPADAAKLLNERGLLVAFLVDGAFEPLTAAHAELKEKLRKGEDPKATFAKIQKLLVDNEQQLRKFANL